LKELGYKTIYVVRAGVSVAPLQELPQKESVATVAFIGRLKRNKLPDHAIKAFNLIKNEIPEARMWIIGDGYMKEKLENMNISDVHFYGHVREDLKYSLLSKAHLILMPSIKEGWGLVVVESNAMGTPVIAYNVGGLRESVIDGETGVLVKENSPKSLSQAAISLLRDRTALSNLSFNAINHSKKFNWDKTADAFDKIIKTELKYN
jgi:glycosyltransferase involved in cell wall biosynthesis